MRDHYEQVTRRSSAEAAIELSGGLDQSKTLVGKPDLLQALELDDIVAAMHPEEKFFEIGTGILASVPVASDSYEERLSSWLDLRLRYQRRALVSLANGCLFH